MGTEAILSSLSAVIWFIWRYSPRNGDGNTTGNKQLLTVSRFGDIVPGMGTETFKLARVNIYSDSEFGDIDPGMGTETLDAIFLRKVFAIFGDIVPGMGTETIVICCGR